MTRHRAALALALALTGAGAGCETVSQVAETVHLSGTAGQVVEATRLATGALADIDEPQEIEIGRAVTAAVGGRYRLLRDPALTRYVAMVGNAVAAHSERPDLRYCFGVLDTPEVNAFAAPGGYVFVTRGALRLMRDEAVLASVLGHEISHVALRHGVDAIRAQKQKELAMFAVREGVAQNRASGFASAVGATAEFFTEQVILKGYSREQETAADRAGVQYAGRAGYDRAGLRDFLAALTERGGEREASRTAFFSTHPGTPERLTEQAQLLQGQRPGGRRNPERFTQAMAVGQPRPAGPTPAPGPGRPGPPTR